MLEHLIFQKMDDASAENLNFETDHDKRTESATRTFSKDMLPQNPETNNTNEEVVQSSEK